MADQNGSKKVIKKVKKVKKQSARALVFIKSSFNNTIVSITDPKGNVLAWASTGAVGFKGSKKSTPYAASTVADNVARKARSVYGVREVEIFVKGIGSGRESAARAIGNAGLEIIAIKDITPVPHNGCRSKKPRRV